MPQYPLRPCPRGNRRTVPNFALGWDLKNKSKFRSVSPEKFIALAVSDRNITTERAANALGDCLALKFG